MRAFIKMLGVVTVSASLAVPASFAQDHHDDHHDDHQADHRNDHYIRHDEWRKGSRLPANDWARGQRIDYRSYHLNSPPHGYEWRAVDGNYVLAAVATGLVSSVVIASTIH